MAALSFQLPIVVFCDSAPRGTIDSVDVNGDCPYCGERVAAHDFEVVESKAAE